MNLWRKYAACGVCRPIWCTNMREDNGWTYIKYVNVLQRRCFGYFVIFCILLFCCLLPSLCCWVRMLDLFRAGFRCDHMWGEKKKIRNNSPQKLPWVQLGNFGKHLSWPREQRNNSFIPLNSGICSATHRPPTMRPSKKFSEFSILPCKHLLHSWRGGAGAGLTISQYTAFHLRTGNSTSPQNHL